MRSSLLTWVFLALAKRVAPGLELHVSTQASTTNWHTVQMWKELGATRVVAAREVSCSRP